MKKKIYIHIGCQKAGSTAIQMFLSVNHEKMLENGLYYPLTGRSPPFEKKENSIFINGDFLRDKEGYKKTLTKHINNFMNLDCNTMLFSEEGLTASDSLSLYNFEVYDDLKEFEVKIIVYLRKSCEYMASLWQECVRNKFFVPDLEPYVLTHAYGETLNKIYELSKIVGKKNIIVKPFEKSLWANNDLIDDFLSIFNIRNCENFQKSKKIINTAMSRNKAEKILYLNRFLTFTDPQNSFEVNDAFFNDKSPNENLGVLESLPDDIIKQVTDTYYAEECKIARIFLGQETLFSNSFPTKYGSKRRQYQKFGLNQEKLLRNFVNGSSRRSHL